MLNVKDIQVNIVTPGVWKQVSDSTTEGSGMSLAGELASGFKEFEKHYTQFKGMRKLNFS
jgi:hypothetical protein